MSTQSVHPLMVCHLKEIESFQQWKDRWDAAEFIKEKLGLLHCLAGGGRDGGLSKDAASFALEVADGYRYAANFGENAGTYQEALQGIAKKAMAVLCAKFFPHDLWIDVITDHGLFDKVLWFLRDDRLGYPYNYCPLGRCLPESHHCILDAFVYDFAKLGWEYHDVVARYSIRLSPDDERRIISARPRFIRILDAIRKLGWLNRSEIQLDRPSIAKLTQLAMEKKCYLPPASVDEDSDNLRPPATLEEALLGGSVAAQIVILNRVRRQETARLKRMFRQSLKQQKANDRARRLAELQRQQQELSRRIAEAGGNG